MNILGEFKGQLWDYQQEDADYAVSRGDLLFGHKTGLGKTPMTLYAATKFGGSRILITGTKSALATWLAEVPKWTEGTPVYIGGKKCNPDKLWEEATTRGKSGIWLISHRRFANYMLKWQNSKKPSWDTLIEDEAHKSKNRNTDLFEGLKKIDVAHRLLASATPVSRGAQDMWAHLNQLDPTGFSSFWRFANEHCWVNKDTYGTSIEGVKDPKKLRELLKKYYRSRRYEDVKKSMPPVRRQPVTVYMGTEQERLYNKLAKDMLLMEGENLIISSGKLAVDVRLRQMALCPQVLDPSFPRGAAVDYLMDEIPTDDQHTVIFSISKAVLDNVAYHLAEQGVKCFRLHGGMEPDEVIEEVTKFKEARGTMLCTIAFAQSFALDTVGRAYVIGIDPDPINNLQAEGRLRRANSVLVEGGVLVRYIIVADTREEDFKDIVNRKIEEVSRFIPDYVS